jgi:recombination protein RecA
MVVLVHDPASSSLGTSAYDGGDGGVGCGRGRSDNGGHGTLGNLAVDLLAHPALRRLGADVETEPAAPPAWNRAELAGRLCELSAGPGGALLSAAMSLVLDAQLAGDPVAWITATAATFYPPDAAACGVDLAALVVVRTSGVRAAGRAADVILRSGAYGLVVLDLGTSAAMPAPLQGRLVQLAQKHDAAVLCLTDKQPDEPSLGSLVSLRGLAVRRRSRSRRSERSQRSQRPLHGQSAGAPADLRTAAAPGEISGFVCRIRALKDKRRGPGWTWQEVRRGPEGLH